MKLQPNRAKFPRTAARPLAAALCAAALLVSTAICQAQGAANYGRSSASSVRALEPHAQDKVLDKVRWEQNLQKQLPLDASFVDETGQSVQLQRYFQGERPVVLAMIFYNCTMLCSQVLNSMMVSLQDVNFTPGKDYDVVVVSIDPTETPELAAVNKKNYLAEYGFTGTEKGWHFLTGTEENIQKVTNTAGYFYTYDEDTKQYAHPGGMVVATTAGKIARYHTGVLYEPRDVRFSLVEAGENKIGSPVDLILLRCFHYDPTTGKYTLAIMQVIRLAFALFVLVLGTTLGVWVRRDMKKEKLINSGSADSGAVGAAGSPLKGS